MKRFAAQIEERLFRVEQSPSGNFTIEGESISVLRSQQDNQKWILKVGDTFFDVSYPKNSESASEYISVYVGGRRFDVKVKDERKQKLEEFGLKGKAKHHRSIITAPMPGLISKILVHEGQEIHAGQGLLVLEAMKMENELKASSAGTIKSINVQPKETVEKNQLLIELI